MTIEDLLQCSPDALEKMTDVELLKHFEPYLKITRPELAERPAANTPRSRQLSLNDSLQKQKHNKARNILASLGIELDI